jgi:hypothetical protein
MNCLREQLLSFFCLAGQLAPAIHNWPITWQSCVTSGAAIHPAVCQLLDVTTRKTRYPWTEPFHGETARGLHVSSN